MTIVEEAKTAWRLYGTPNEFNITMTEEGFINLNNRWTFDPALGNVLLLSKEFLESIMCYTHITDIEWGGFIVGEDLKYINMETGSVCRVLICERAIVLGQARSGTSFDIPADVVASWIEDDDYVIPEQSFKTVYIDNKWKKIGWVHSHHTMGAWWSRTDDDTIADFDMPGIVSIVVAKLANGLERRIRVDKHDFWFGGIVRPYRDEIASKFVVEEEIFGGIEDMSEDVKSYYEDILKKVDTISGVEEKTETTGTTTTTTVTKYHPTGKSYTTTYYTKAPYQRVLSVHGFVTELCKDPTVRYLLNPYGYPLETDMSIVIKRLDVSHILDIFESLYRDTSLVGTLDFNFKNFRYLIRDFINGVNSLPTDVIKSIEVGIFERSFDDDWQKMMLENLEQTVSYSWHSMSDDADSEGRWKAYISYLTKDSLETILKVLEGSEVSDNRVSDAIRKIRYKYTSNKKEVAGNAVEMIRKLENAVNELPDGEREIGESFVRSVIGDILEPMLKSYSNLNPAVGYILNNLNDEEVKPFLAKYIALFDDDRDLHRLKELGRIAQYRKEYHCEICNNVWSTEEEAKKCASICGAKRDTKGDGIKMLEATASSDVKAKTLGALFRQQHKSKGLPSRVDRVGEDGSFESPTAIDILVSNIMSSDEDLLVDVGKNFYTTTVCMYCGLEYPTFQLAFECESKCSQELDIYWRKNDPLCPTCLSIETVLDYDFNEDDDYMLEHHLYCEEKAIVMAYILKECLKGQNLDVLYDHLEVRRGGYTKIPRLFRLLLRMEGSPEVFQNEYEIPEQYIRWLYDEPEEEVEGKSEMPANNPKGRFVCPYCDIIETYEDYLLWHVAETHDIDKNVIPSTFDESIDEYFNWVYTKVARGDEPFYKCEYCNMVFSGISSRFLWYLHEKGHRDGEV